MDGGHVPPALRPARPLRRPARDDRPLPRAHALQRAGPHLAARLTALLVALLLVGCGEEEQSSPPPDRGGVEVEVVLTGLEVPWEIVWLPDGRGLITERGGRIRVVDGGVVAEVP